MTTSDRVIWDEGMLLVPQHFQQWSRFLEAEMRRRVAEGVATDDVHCQVLAYLLHHASS